MSAGPRCALTGAAWLTVAVAWNQYVLRFVLPTDLLAPLGNARHAAHDAAVFAAAWPLFVAYAASASLAALTAPTAMTAALAGSSRTSGTFKLACLATALTGAAAGVALGAGGAGGAPMIYYWIGLAGLWSGSLALLAWAERRGHRMLVRDWTLYAGSLSALPPPVLALTWLWAQVPGFDLDDALITAVTLAFTGQIYLAHYAAAGLPGQRRSTSTA